MFEIEKNVSLKDFCTFQIGGCAKFLCVAKTRAQLIDVCKYCKSHNIKYKIIGLGANLLFDDLGFDGMIIVNKTCNIMFRKSKEAKILSYRSKRGSSASSISCRFAPLTSFGRNDKANNYFIYVDSGVNVTNLIMKCCLRSLCGLEQLAGIPSTVGGAVVNSLGAFDTNFSDYIEYVECYHKDDLNKKIRLSNQQCQFRYRSSLFKNSDYIITRVKLRLIQDDKTLIQKRIKQAVEKKQSTQPINLPSAGSVFKRGNIIPAKAIDELGLKGTKIGDAEISTKHAGFIVNTRSANSKDVKDLISFIQKQVKDQYNEEIETEIEFVEY